MKIKTPTEFIPFKDGVCNIYTENEEDEKVYKYKNIYFNNKTLGFKRAYAAQAVNSGSYNAQTFADRQYHAESNTTSCCSSAQKTTWL